jgi:putative copper resistance protein D
VSAGPDPLLVVGRFLVLTLALVLFGDACFSVSAPEAAPRSAGAARLLLPSAAAVAGLAWIVLIARQATGASDLPDAAAVLRLSLETVAGRALCAMVLLCLLACAAPGVTLGQRRARVLLSALILVSLAFVGHAAAGQGAAGGIRKAVMALHLLAAGAWLGGLPSLALALRARRSPPAELLDAFGRRALLAVVVALGSGLVSILYVVITSGGGLGSAYLRVLSFKLGLVGGLLLIAATNRYGLTPLARRNARHAAVLTQASLLLEQAVALGLVAVVALLGQLDPTM